MFALVEAVEVPTQGCLCIVSYLHVCVALLECSVCNMSFHGLKERNPSIFRILEAHALLAYSRIALGRGVRRDFPGVR